MQRRNTGPVLLPVVVALVALLTGACGIPDETGVTVVGAGPSTGISSVGDGGKTKVTRQEAGNDRAQFVENYLKAAAGDLDTAAERMRGFMTKDVAKGFKPTSADVRVVRLVADPLVTRGNDVVKLTYEQVGTLDKFGLLEPATEAGPITSEVRVSSVDGEPGLFVTEAPPVLLLSDVGLESSYDEQTIYFWNTDYSGLVPDVRYMPKAVPVEQRPTMIINWLANGPAPWLSVSDLLDGFGLIGKVPAISDNKLQITLTAQSLPATDAAVAQERLRQQLQWSLRPLLPAAAELDLKIGFDVRSYTGEDYLGSNPAYRLVDDPEWFVVFDGKIRRHTGSASAAPVPVLKPEENKDVRLAAMSTSRRYTFAAVVTRTGKTDALRVAAAPTGSQAPLQTVSGLPSPLGKPTWAVTKDDSEAGAVGLITANGNLYSFSTKKGTARQIPWTGPGNKITAVAVAPDGRRVALVVDNKLYRAALNTGGDTPALGTPQQIRPASLSDVTAVAFSSESRLTVAGPRIDDNRVTVVDVSIDGALKESDRLRSELKGKSVESLSVYPANPTASNGSDSVCYSADGKAWNVLYTVSQIGVDKLAGQFPNPLPDKVPTFSFYLE
ncbi:LpqB family beta-propeller domain-containing protein [Actinoplanes regularis]|uniref:Lipoprotein LpqB beta-propeller domain-containing protein n=1 Tax=Actinoplanes regularis TaxID=52697 RepID=A0A238XPV6_9ACTN|nr:LpqB family beta-propeller domain-containing protein [Actinoplanes regularis]GIE90582.1 hypothetical protein Are01nite_70620 [Actinoplanes regularis]SNR60029.1 Lipoprotein LpqB beta-propeller domain-containing protein [Actinoplanes regularis]